MSDNRSLVLGAAIDTLVERSTAASGVPLTIADPVVLERVATLISNAPAAKDRTATPVALLGAPGDVDSRRVESVVGAKRQGNRHRRHDFADPGDHLGPSQPLAVGLAG